MQRVKFDAEARRRKGRKETGETPEVRHESRAMDPFPLYGLAGVGFNFRHSRENGNPEGTRGLPAESSIRNQVRTAVDKSLPPLWGKARMGVSRASAVGAFVRIRIYRICQASASFAIVLTGFSVMAKIAFCQNQDLQDSSGARPLAPPSASSAIVLAGFSVMARIAIWATMKSCKSR